jgi:hypothetical protein
VYSLCFHFERTEFGHNAEIYGCTIGGQVVMPDKVDGVGTMRHVRQCSLGQASEFNSCSLQPFVPVRAVSILAKGVCGPRDGVEHGMS